MKLSIPLYAFSLLALVACGRGEDGDRDSTAESLILTDETLAQTEREADRLLGTDGRRQRAVWDHLADGGLWSREVLRAFRASPSAFEAARDVEDFCPRYATASKSQRETCWLRIVSAMARFESNFIPTATYKEHTGSVSVGLLMMNPEHCPEAKTIPALKDAGANIRCAMTRMSRLISRDQAISAGAPALGAAAYWSVLRAPYRFRDLQLGKKLHVQKFTRSYLAYSAR